MRIEITEVIAAMESHNVGRLTAMWTVVAFLQAQGELENAKVFASQLGCKDGVAIVEEHVKQLPLRQRGFIHE